MGFHILIFFILDKIINWYCREIRKQHCRKRALAGTSRPTPNPSKNLILIWFDLFLKCLQKWGKSRGFWLDTTRGVFSF